jgi:uncharacterized membrane protein
MKMSIMRDSAADLDSAWSALVNVTDWPQWTASIRSVKRLDDGPLRIGSRTRVNQPKFPTIVWEVTELRDREAFTWAAGGPGVHTIGRHTLSRNTDGTTRITLEIEQTGALAGIFGLLTARRTRRYLAMEAAGLKAAGEASARR